MAWPEGLKPGDPAVDGQAQCRTAGCSQGLWWTGKGQRPNHCDDHRNNPPRHAPGSTLVPVPSAPSHQYAQREKRKQARAESDARLKSKQAIARLLAIAMRMEPNAVKALEMAGLDELAALAGHDEKAIIRLAKSKAYEPIRQGLQTELAKTATIGLQLMLERIINEHQEIPISTLPFAMSQQIRAIQILGGFELAHTELRYERIIREYDPAPANED